jgi:sugar-specific transcriptional regulator TrmB
MEEKFLENAGLTRGEVKIYITLIELGQAFAGKIAEKSGMHRRSVYDSINRLMEKGLASYVVINDKKYFEAANPERLLYILKEKEDEVSSVLSELKEKYKRSKVKESITVFRGKEGLKTLFDGQIKTGKDISILGASPAANEMLKYYFVEYDKKRIKNGIKVKIIFSNKLKGKHKKAPLSEIKYLSDEYSGPAAINIYGNNVAIIHWSEKPDGILIESEGIADSYRKYFDLIWRIAKK